jgi:hypothetical protein
VTFDYEILKLQFAGWNELTTEQLADLRYYLRKRFERMALVPVDENGKPIAEATTPECLQRSHDHRWCNYNDYLNRCPHFARNTLEGCDNSHRHTLAWAALRKLDPDDVLASVASFGGCCCDCEVLLNAPDEELGRPGLRASLRLLGGLRR